MSEIYFPTDLKTVEDGLVRNRRIHNETKPDGPRIGLALSGGGIRSATFCLGFLQALAARKVLRRFDYLSTVSGGGYIGSFLGKWINQRGIAVVEQELANAQSKPIAFLRENGRYLAPNGTGDGLSAAAGYLRNWLTCTLVMGTLGLALFFFIEVLRAYFFPETYCAPYLIFGNVVLSPFCRWAVLAVILADIPLVFAFWFPSKSVIRAGAPWCLVLVIAILLGWHLHGRPDVRWRNLQDKETLFAWEVGMTILVAAASQVVVSLARDWSANWMRLKLTQLLGYAIVVTAVLALLASVDTLVLTLSKVHFSAALFSGALVSLPAILGAGSKVLPWISEFTKRKDTGLGSTLLIGLVAIIVALGVLVTLGFAAHFVALNMPDAFPAEDGTPEISALHLFWITVGAFGCAVLLGRAGFWFVNYASFHRVYSSRLTRAYLGASNPERQDGTKNWSMTDLLPGDDIAYRSYRPHEHGGPIHLVNATVNETVSSRSNTEKRDRKGFGLSLGPAGITAGKSDYILFDPNPAKRPAKGYASMRQRAAGDGADAAAAPSAPSDLDVEMMSLGNWVGISGAALSTGMGAKTSVATSFLIGYFNLRLGYWWDSSKKPWVAGGHQEFEVHRSYSRSLFAYILPAQEALLSEYLASFRGPERRLWYLTDGGHFENTGIYELIRRKLELIICCDCGCDPEYTFDDLGNLVRVARLDFGAEISFLTPASYGLLPAHIRRIGGLIDETIPESSKLMPETAARQVAVATVVYNDGSKGVIVVVKPSVYLGGPLDVRNYALDQPDFPQQSTLEQFFDEAQWESYRKLGELLGGRLLGNDGPAATETLDSLLSVAG